MNKKIFAAITCTTVVLIGLTGCFEKTPDVTARLIFYGLDDSDIIQPIIQDYHSAHPGITIKYKKFNEPQDFENLVVNEIAEGEGPDMFYLPNTWLPRNIKKLVPLQSDTVTPATFEQAFVGVAGKDFVQPNPATGQPAIYAVPLYVDTLALYYNKANFERTIPERGKPASTWDQFKTEADRFVSLKQDGTLVHGAAAFGRSDNIRLASDILSNFLLQTGDSLYSADFRRLQLPKDAAQFFEYFMSFGKPINKNYSWSPEMPDEVTAFLSGKVSAIMAYSDLASRLSTELKNANSKTGSGISASDVGIAPSPQISTDPTRQLVWAHYYGVGVSRNSKNPTAAWDFLQFLISQKNARTYLQKTHRPTARRDLLDEQKTQPNLDVFVSQLGIAGSFPLISETQFNDSLKNVITDVLNGAQLRESLNKAEAKLNQKLQTEAPDGLYPQTKK